MLPKSIHNIAIVHYKEILEKEEFKDFRLTMLNMLKNLINNAYRDENRFK